MDQRRLVERAKQGDHDAFAELVRGAIARLDTAARLILRDPDLARDAVQDALIRAWRDLRGLRDPGRFDAWLYRLTVNACLDLARRRRRRPIEVEIETMFAPSDPDHADEVADRALVDDILRNLDPQGRAIVVLHYILGMPLTEVAACLGIPVGTVKSTAQPGADLDAIGRGSDGGDTVARRERTPGMNGDRPIDRNLLRAFGRFRAGAQPDYTDAVLARTATIRQRPAWAVRERWFPMDVVTERVAGPRLPWRALAIVALVMIALAVGGVLTASTREPRLPAPVRPGPQRPPCIRLLASGRRVCRRRGSAGTPRPLITGPDFDTTPSFSRDGTSLAFMRAATADPAAPRRPMIANADGTDLRP